MKLNLTFAIALITILFSCSTQPTTIDPPVKFTVNAFDVPNGVMEVSFAIKNPSQETWEGGQWTLHWNQFSGKIQPESLPEGMSLAPTKNSQYWIVSMGENHSLSPGETLEFTVRQSGIMERIVMGPIGFFVHHSKTDQLYDLEHTIDWENAKGVEALRLPTAAARYANYAGVNPLPKEELHWVIPTPVTLNLKGAYTPLTNSLSLNLGPFSDHASFLTERLQEGVQLQVSSSEEEGTAVSLLKNNALAAEAYTLSITSDGITIEASAYGGAFYGITSLHQILLTAEKEQMGLPLLYIEDAPRFQHRGFMTDIARNFFPKEKFIQILDYMAHYKLNLIDIKLGDDEGWRIEIPDLPELIEVGSKRGFTLDEKDRLFPMYGSGSGNKASSGSGYLTRADFIEILTEAAKRNIKVVPQVSFPSHARAAVISMKARYDHYLAQGDEKAANEYRLHDPEDQSEYTSAQLFKDNTICICDDAAYRFFEKVMREIKAMYVEANLPMEVYNIGADELPYGVWQKSPLCETYLNSHPELNSYQDLYDANVKRLSELISATGARMAGWEDVLLVHSAKSQSEITVNQKLKSIDFTPYVWNNSWGEGREDMIYKLNNMGIPAIMSNSSAFYFDMTDDRDMDNGGLSWSGYVNFKDSWGTEPYDVFANKVKLEELGITEEYVANKEKLRPDAVSNFLGIQSQLWTETATNEQEFNRLLMPNLLVFAERAWSPAEPWLDEPSATAQKPLLEKAWNRFANTLGQRQLIHLNHLYGGITFDLPKPGGIVQDGKLSVNQQFPGLNVHYTLTGQVPTLQDPIYTESLSVPEGSKISLRLFDASGRGGASITLE